MFRTRLISGIVLVLIALITIISGGPLLAGTLFFVSLIAYSELAKALQLRDANGKRTILENAGMLMTMLYYVATFCAFYDNKPDRMEHFVMILAGGILIMILVFLFLYVFTFPTFKTGHVMTAVFSFLYAPVMLSLIYAIRQGYAAGAYLVWFVFLCSWGSDTCAYAIGVLFGKHKMTPKLSPKKSIEGAVGGIVGSALLCVVYTHFVVNAFIDDEFSLFAAAVLGMVGALVSMVGDLAASAIKRDHAIKDYGKLIPGHGGIMDRFDSVIITTPLIFLGLLIMDQFLGMM